MGQGKWEEMKETASKVVEKVVKAVTPKSPYSGAADAARKRTIEAETEDPKVK